MYNGRVVAKEVREFEVIRRVVKFKSLYGKV